MTVFVFYVHLLILVDLTICNALPTRLPRNRSKLLQLVPKSKKPQSVMTSAPSVFKTRIKKKKIFFSPTLMFELLFKAF